MKTSFFMFVGFILLTSLTHPQTHTEELRFEALRLMNSGRYGEAIDVLNRFIASNPQDVDGFLLRGKCFEERGTYEMAVYDYRTAQKIAPENPEVNTKLKLASENWYKLLYNKIEGHKREIAVYPGRAVNYLEIGIAYKNLGEWKEAEIWYDEYLKREEPSADEVLRYTEILARNNQLTKGEQVLKKYSATYLGDHRLLSRYGYFLYWLGKHRMAISTFEEALKERPFFKEALDGLDLARGKGYIYTINDTTKRYVYGLPPVKAEYKIDRLLRNLKNNPDDDDTRFKLIDELVKVNRFEEAYEQLKFLAPRYITIDDFNLLYTRVMEYKTAYYKSKIEEFELKLSRSPDNSDAILNLARYYSYLGEYDSSRRMYEYYLRIKPGDKDVRFKYAQLLSWNNELCLAKDELIKLLEKNPDKSEYQLLLANIGLWLDDDLEKSESLFQKVLSKNTGEKTALYGLAYVYLMNGKINEAEKYYGKLEKIENSTSNELVELESNILVTKKRNYSDMLYEILEKARKAVFENNCYIAIDEFNRYFEKGGTEQSVYFELANAYQCVNDYTSAINIYDDIIRSGQDDFDIVKQRAKIIYWSGDSLSAFREFKKLVDSHPEDAETRLYLGDCYFQLKQYQSAREIYNGLLNEAPGSHIIKSRLKWLGSAGVTSFSFDSFPTYMLLSPQGYHFTDNTGFRYNLFGAGFELGATDYLSVGLSGFRGYLSSDSRRLNFNNLKGALFLKLNEFIRFSLTAGQTYFTSNLNEIIIESSINIARKDIYTVSVFYNKMDAAFILFSPFLVENRLNAEHFGLSGDYSFNKGFLISGKYALIRVSDRNDGDQLQLRFGKEFDDYFKIGYEYYLFNFSERTELYWSPANFESHSIWSDVILFDDDEINFSVGGKLGLIPENDFLLRELNTQFDYKVTNSFNLRARFVTGSSSRAGAGYNSTSVQLGIFLGL
jgi:tetratricopeptide (TPR) repeat protein